MKSNFFYILLLLFIIDNAALAQNTQTTSGTNINRLSRNDWGSIMRGNQPMMTKKRENIELRGHTFFRDEWVKGAIIVSDSLYSKSEHKYKLDVTDHEIWYQTEKGDPLVLIDKRIMGLDLFFKDSIISFRKIPIPELKKDPWRFVQVMHKGERYSLLKYVQKEFIQANGVDKGLAVVGRSYDSYETFTSYYVVNEKKQLRKIQLKRNDIYKVNYSQVQQNRDAINAFCKENNISSPLEEDEAVALIQFLETLK